MSKRHFEKLAAIIREGYKIADSYRENGGAWEGYATARGDAVSSMAQAIADMCQDENERFDRNRFLDACQPSKKK